MSAAYFRRRIELLRARLEALGPSLERADEAIRRLEHKETNTPATAAARAAQLSAAHAMRNTLAARARNMRVAISALSAEIDGVSLGQGLL